MTVSHGCLRAWIPTWVHDEATVGLNATVPGGAVASAAEIVDLAVGIGVAAVLGSVVVLHSVHGGRPHCFGAPALRADRWRRPQQRLTVVDRSLIG